MIYLIYFKHNVFFFKYVFLFFILIYFQKIYLPQKYLSWFTKKLEKNVSRAAAKQKLEKIIIPREYSTIIKRLKVRILWFMKISVSFLSAYDLIL